jgi:phage host-nuclease inhibitor protein Gam
MADDELPIATYAAPEPQLDFASSTAAFESPTHHTDELLPPAKNLKAPKMSLDSLDVQQLFVQGIGLTQQSVAQLQLQVNTLNTVTQDHTSEIDNLGEQLSNLDGEIVSLDTNLATLTANLGLTDGNVTALEGRVDTAETNIEDLDADMLLKQNINEKDAANGYAGLNPDAKVPLPSLIEASGLSGVWLGNTTTPSDRTMAVMVLDTADNRLKPLNSSVIATYWHMGAVADELTNLIATKTDNSVTSGIDTRVTTNTNAIATINTTSLPAKQDTSGKNANNGYVGVDGAGSIAISCSNVRRGAAYLSNVCRLHISGADYVPGTNSGTISAWKVITDTFYNYNNAYGAGFKGTTNRTFFKAARDAIISVKGNIAFSIATATNNKFFTLRVTPVNSSNTPTPLQYNYGLINGTTGSQSYSFAVDIPMRTGDSLSFEWNLGTAPTFQQDYTYLHITEASNGISAADWFP